MCFLRSVATMVGTWLQKFFEGGRLEERGQGMIKLDEMNIVPTAVLGSRYENTLNQLG